MSATGETSERYGFGGRLKERFPSQLIVDVAETCNLACVHCPYPEFRASSHYSGAFLDADLNAKLVDEVRAHGHDATQYIRYTSNGEPLIHPQIFDMLGYAAENSGVLVTLTTNGTLLNEKRIDRLVATGVDVVDISLDAFRPETYAAVRVKGDLEVTRQNLLDLLARTRQAPAGTKRTRVVVSFVELAQNTTEIEEFEAFWTEHGADHVVVRRQHTFSGAKKELAKERRKNNAEVDRRPCLYPWERMVLNPLGYLSYCPSDWVHGSKIVDYRTTTIQATWQGEFYRELRQAHLTNDFRCSRFCQQCPDWRQTRWPHEGRSYANMMAEFKDTE